LNTFSAATGRRQFGLDPPPPSDEDILGMIRATNQGIEDEGLGGKPIPETIESVVAFRARLV